MGVVKGGEFKFFGLGRELFFVFSNERLFVLEGSLYKRLFANVFPLGSFWSLKKLLTEKNELEGRNLEEIEEKAEFVLPYSGIERCELSKKQGIARLKFLFQGKTREFAFPFRIDEKNPTDFFPLFFEELGISLS